MDLTQIPFNRMIGIVSESPDSGLLLSLPESSQYFNHIETVHAGALLSLAEASSGEYLLRVLGELPGFVPVVRRLEAKFRRPARGRISSKARVAKDAVERLLSDAAGKGRGAISVSVELIDAGGETVMTAVVDWFVGAASDRDGGRVPTEDSRS